MNHIVNLLDTVPEFDFQNPSEQDLSRMTKALNLADTETNRDMIKSCTWCILLIWYLFEINIL